MHARMHACKQGRTLAHSFARSLIHSLTHSHALPHTHPPTHPLTHALTHPLTHTLTHTHSLIHSLTHPPTNSHTHTHSFTQFYCQCPAFHSVPLPLVEYVDFTRYSSMLKVVRERYQFSHPSRLPPIRTSNHPERLTITNGPLISHGHAGDHSDRVRARMCGHAGDHDHTGTIGLTDDRSHTGAYGDTAAFGNAGDNAQRHR